MMARLGCVGFKSRSCTAGRWGQLQRNFPLFCFFGGTIFPRDSGIVFEKLTAFGRVVRWSIYSDLICPPNEI